MTKRDYYDILDIGRSAGKDEIKKAYRRLARKYHPDTARGTDADERFKEVHEAYSVLNDPEKRRIYDRFGHAGLKMDAGAAGRPPGGAGRGWPGGPADQSGQPFNWNVGQGGGEFEFDLSDFFGGGGMGDVFDRLRSQAGARPGTHPGACPGGRAGVRPGHSAAQRGANIEHTVRLSFDEAIAGTTRDVVATVQQSDGHRRRERITVKIPPGVDTNSKVRVRGKGQPGTTGADGDLIIKIEVEPHRYFSRQGNDIYLDVPLTVSEAAIGAKIDVPTLSGTTTVTIPPGSGGGRRLRLRGKGVKSRRGDKVGDMFLVMHIAMPNKLDEQSQQLLRDFASQNPQDDIRKDWE